MLSEPVLLISVINCYLRPGRVPAGLTFWIPVLQHKHYGKLKSASGSGLCRLKVLQKLTRLLPAVELEDVPASWGIGWAICVKGLTSHRGRPDLLQCCALPLSLLLPVHRDHCSIANKKQSQCDTFLYLLVHAILDTVSLKLRFNSDNDFLYW